MNRFQYARLASLICLMGSALQILYGLLAIPFPYAQSNATWPEVLWALANVGMIGGSLGLLVLDIARPRWLAVIGATLTILGNLIRIVVSALLILLPSQTAYVPYILMSIFLIILGMSGLGIATLLGKQLSGWQAWTPLLAAGFTLIPAAIYSINQYSILSSSAFGVFPGCSSAMWSSRTQPNSSRPNIMLHLEQPSTHRRENCLP